MKFWVDAQLPPKLAEWLSKEFAVDAVSVRDIGLRDAPDLDIFRAALGARATLVSTNPSLLTWFNSSTSRNGPVRLTAVLRDDATTTSTGLGVTADARDVEGRAVEGGVRVTIAGGLAGRVRQEWPPTAIY